MTDTVLNSPPITSTAKPWKGIKAAFRTNKPSEDQASFHMLSLARTNLGVRLRAIDETSLVSQTQKNIYAIVAEMLKAAAEASAQSRMGRNLQNGKPDRIVVQRRAATTRDRRASAGACKIRPGRS
jgi:hypothetical protein